MSMNSWRRFYPLRKPIQEIGNAPGDYPEIKAHRLTVVTDDGDGRGLRVSRRVFLDDRELLVPTGASVTVEASNTDLMIATVRLIAEVQFVEELPTEDEAPAS